ncbi:hypothetical protein [Acidovorax sp.]|uniref:hypothetical protein n=1 Tax=Acidovorax sp. TaxID=1872122 RepID=UPI0031E3F463
MNKTELALVEWYRAKAAVAAMDKQIGEALSDSLMAAPDGDKWEGKNKWLKLAYEQKYAGPYEGWYYVNHDDDIEGFLAENCPHALRAHRLIQERKPMRQALGAAKRRVSLIANRLAKEAA